VSIDVEQAGEDYASGSPEAVRAGVLQANAAAAEGIRLLRPEIWQQLRWRPHSLQRDVLLSTARNRVMAAGRRAGKSQTGGHTLIPYALQTLAEIPWLDSIDHRREYWIVGPEYSDAEKEFRVVYNGLRRLGLTFDKPGTYNNPLSGEMHISLWDGKFQVHAKSAKYPDTLVGEGLSGVLMSEAAKLKPSVWTKFIRPALADFAGWAWFGSTPEGRNWFYRLWEAGKDPTRTDWASWRAPSWSNPFVYPKGANDAAVKELRSWIKKAHIPEQIPLALADAFGFSQESWHNAQEKTWQGFGALLGIDPEIIALMLDISEELFNQEIAALFNEFVGRVFKDFDEEIHVGDFKFDPTWRTYAALDYGFTNPFVWLLIQEDPHGEQVRVLAEYYETGKTTEEAAREIVARGLRPEALLGFFPDPAEPDRSKQLSGLLSLRQLGPTGGPLEDRLEWIRRKLKPHPLIAHLDPSHEEWNPQLMINRRCVRTIADFNKYRYPKTYDEMAERDTNAPEVPLKKDDHAPEALGRFMAGRYGSPWTAAGARQSRARVSRSRTRRRG
jgi:hypothetical protein